MPGQDGIDDLWDHGVVVAHDARKDRAALTQFARQIVAHFIFDMACQQNFFGKRTLTQLTERARKTHDGKPQQQNISGVIIRPLDKAIRSSQRRNSASNAMGVHPTYDALSLSYVLFLAF